MDNSNNINIISELIKILGYSKDDLEKPNCDKKENKKNSCSCKIDPSGGADSNCCYNADLDIKGGFQNIDPFLFSLIGEILGNIISGKLPFNVANSVANFLALVGQILETYAAQQQYQQSGPGRFFNSAYKNVDNPFCQSISEDDSTDAFPGTSDDRLESIDIQLKNITESIKNLDNRIYLIEVELNKINERK